MSWQILGAYVLRLGPILMIEIARDGDNTDYVMPARGNQRGHSTSA
ncbi:hypothetical protein [Methylobacillus glycogenes]|nr:hypothetical protein [Methylobacillus glycogenes]